MSWLELKLRTSSADAEAYGYLVDMIEQAAGANRRRRFLVHAHVGNYSLFMTGVFGAFLEERGRLTLLCLDELEQGPAGIRLPAA